MPRTVILQELATLAPAKEMRPIMRMLQQVITAAGVTEPIGISKKPDHGSMRRIEVEFPANSEERDRIAHLLLRLDVLYRTANSHGEPLPEDKLFDDTERQQVFAWSPEEWKKVWEKRDETAKEHHHLHRRHIRAALKDTLAELAKAE